MAVAKMTDKEKLAAGAAEIRKAEAQAADDKPFTEKELKPTREIKEVLRDRVTVLDAHLGLKLSPHTTPAENLQILDHVVQMGDHVQFLIGDVINEGQWRWGEKKYNDAMNRTGRSRGNLWNIASIARRIPFKFRKAELSFSAHRPVAVLADLPEKGNLTESVKSLEKVLNEAVTRIKTDGEPPSEADLRQKVKELLPPKAKKPVPRSRDKNGKARPDEEPYEPTDTEEAKLDNFMDALEDAESAGREIKAVLLKISNKRKREFTKAIEWLCGLGTEIEKSTGY
jgi:hypothetical protein